MIKIKRKFLLLFSWWYLLCSASCEVVASGVSDQEKKYNEEIKYIVGHYRNGLLYSPVYQIEHVPVQRLTHLIYQSASLTPNGTVDPGDRFIDIQKLYLDLDIEKIPYAGNFAKLVQLKQKYPHLKVLISIGKWGQSKDFLLITSTSEGRKELAVSCVDFMLDYHFDGIDIYWQPFEVEKLVAFNDFQTDRTRFVEFMKELRAELQRRKSDAILTTTLKMAAFTYSWPMKDLADQVDFINLSAAYFHGAWETTTNHISPIYDVPGQPSVDAMLHFLLGGDVPANKIVLDIVTYAQARQGIENVNNGLYQHANAISLGSWDATRDFTGLYSRNHMQKIIAMPGYTEYWDDTAKAAYAFNPNRYSGHFISYENERSIAAKIDYVNAKGLRGVGVLDMHNDEYDQDSLLVFIHKRFYFFQHLKISLLDYIQNNRENIIEFIEYFSSITFILLLLAAIYWSKQKKINTEVKYLHSQQDNLLVLEWALLQLVYLSSYSKKYANFFQIAQIIPIASTLFQAITQVVSRSEVRYWTKNIDVQPVNLLTVLGNAKVSVSETKKDTDILIMISNDIFVRSDYMLLTQLIYRLCAVLSVDGRGNRVAVNSLSNQDGSIVLQFSINDEYGVDSKSDYFLLKDAYVVASSLGLTLLRSDPNKTALSLYFPATTIVDRSPPLLSVSHPTPLTLNKLDSTQTVSVTSDQQFSSYFSKFTALIGQEVEKSRDASKLIEWACESFLEMNDVLHIQVSQSEQKIGVYGNEPLELGAVSEVMNDDLKFTIHSSQPLKKEESAIFDVLVNQVQLVRKALKGLAKDSKLLNELHFLSANRDRILYIQADDGYSFVHLEDVKQPKILSITLRAIKYFFDDGTYLQIHRSCIVNPDKVKKVQQLQKMKYEVVLNNKKIPLSRVYVASLKVKYPHWFL